MRTRRKERDTPGPSEPWNEIVPGLWMGGHYRTPPGGELEPVVVRHEFDLVVSLFTLPGHGPAPGVEHLVREVPDGPLSPGQLLAVQEAAELTVAAVRRGRRTLVRCHSGYNRSGLVVAQALTDLGHGTDEAVRTVRERRSPWALNNPVFVEYLNTGLEVSALLTGLNG
ncbi:dual specificity protein phosphatase family protein [Streptomyces sp. FH025]|uniref:protein-tyrosine phosphatase family protein n=1 Tax=Streptomyces sp. FH025 TaxID=2815937 RepID=UPI001A9CC419|nr:dual specificity protein phosphatase family protein [Streptomyces sp. FH025]MBO1413117.1 dual specificity protein phosphatase family protein [Streptomyces sp. FH025]